MEDKSIKIISWNINGVKPHRALLQLLINKEQPQILLIQEAKVDHKTANKCNINGYEQHTTTKWRNEHNIIAYFRKDIGMTVTEVNITQELLNPTQKFRVRFKGCNKVHTIIHTYSIHKHNSLDIDYLYTEAERTQNLIIAGDLNSKGTRHAQLENLMYDCDLLDTNTDEIPTHNFLGEKGHTQTQIDHIIISDTLVPDFISFHTKEYSTSTFSFHWPIEAIFRINCTEIKVPKRNFRKLDKDLYQEAITKQLDLHLPNTLKTTEDLDRESDKIDAIMHAALDEALPKKVPKPRKKEWYTSSAAKLLQDLKERARSNYRKTSNPVLAEQYRIISNKLDNELTTQMNYDRRKKYTEEVNKITENPPSKREFWTETNHLAGITQSRTNAREIKYNDQISSEPEGKAKIHLDYQNTVFRETENTTEAGKKYWNEVVLPNYELLEHNERLRASEPDFAVIEEITMRDMKDNLRTLKGYKAPGPNDLGPICLKWATDDLLERIIKLYNACLKMSYQPKKWKEAKLILIPKPGKNHSSPDGYRPLSLLNTIAKLLDKIITKRLMKYAENATKINDPTKPLLPDCQAGFRIGRGTNENIFRFSHQIAINSQGNFSTVMDSLDAQKAFDKTAHKGILSSLMDLVKSNQLPMYIALYFKIFLEGRTFRVQQESYITEEVGQILAGVPQGSHSGPALYLIYTADIPEPPNHTSQLMNNNFTRDEKARFNNDLKRSKFLPYEMGTYADDVGNTYRVDQEMLKSTANWDLPELVSQSHMNLIEAWADKKKIKFNAGKTQYMVIHPRYNKANKKIPKLKFCGENVENKDTLTYLGVKYDEKGSMDPFVKEQINKASSRINRVGNMICRSNVTYKTAIHMMKTLAIPYLLYGSITWIAMEKHRQSINRVFNLARRRALKLCRGRSNTYMRQFIPDMDIAQWCININKKWYEKAKDLPSVKHTVNTIVPINNRKKRKVGVIPSPLTCLQ